MLLRKSGPFPLLNRHTHRFGRKSTAGRPASSGGTKTITEKRYFVKNKILSCGCCDSTFFKKSVDELYNKLEDLDKSQEIMCFAKFDIIVYYIQCAECWKSPRRRRRARKARRRE
jgi:hypothetical protein